MEPLHTARSRPSRRARCLALLLALLLCWELGLLLRQGLAALYASSGATFRVQAFALPDPVAREPLLERGLGLLDKALALDPANPDYRLLAARLIDAGSAAQSSQRAATARTIHDHLLVALASAPTRADLWGALARASYNLEGPSPATMAVLRRALQLGPREIEPLLANALITFYGWNALTESQRREGWLHIAVAMEVEGLAPTLLAQASATGWERQLRQLQVAQAAASGEQP